MKFSIRLNNDLPVADYLHIAQVAEAAGFDQMWVSNDLFLQSAPVILSAIASTTKRIQIGSCILNPYTINPAEIAMMAGTLGELSGGRFLLGISSGAANFLEWVGIVPEKPRTAVVESVRAIRGLLAGERTLMSGAFLQWTNEAYLRFPVPPPVPIYIGATSPRMLREIGRIADGGLPLLFPPEHYAQVLPYIQDGVNEAGRNIDDVDIAACIWCSVADDKDAADDVLREKIAYYGYALSPMILQQLGLTRNDFTEIERAVMQEQDMGRAKALVTPQMLRIGVSGTTDILIQRLENLVAMGVQHLSFGPPLGPDILAAITAIGRDVIPYFKES